MSGAGWVFVNLDTGTTDGLAESAYAIDLDRLDDGQREVLEDADTVGHYGPEAEAVVTTVGVSLLPLVAGLGAAVDSVSCPVCGSAEVTGGFVEVLDNAAWQSVDCDDCGSSWEDVYTLSGRENVRRGDRVEIALTRRAVRS